MIRVLDILFSYCVKKIRVLDMLIVVFTFCAKDSCIGYVDCFCILCKKIRVLELIIVFAFCAKRIVY